jgi:hypothetical protein
MIELTEKKKLPEQGISTKFIAPAIQRSGLDVMLQVSGIATIFRTVFNNKKSKPCPAIKKQLPLRIQDIISPAGYLIKAVSCQNR